MRHILRVKKEAFTLIEVVAAFTILVIVVTGFLVAIVSGEKSRILSLAQIEVQSEVRRAIDWIAKDVRQARRVDIGSGANNPSASHIKFQMVSGYDTAGLGSVLLSSSTIEYDHIPNDRSIVRKETKPSSQAGGQPIITTWVFNHIVEPPFYTKIKDPDGGHSIISIDPPVPGGDSPVFQTGNLVIKIVGQKSVGNGLTPEYVLMEEVLIRN